MKVIVLQKEEKVDTGSRIENLIWCCHQLVGNNYIYQRSIMTSSLLQIVCKVFQELSVKLEMSDMLRLPVTIEITSTFMDQLPYRTNLVHRVNLIVNLLDLTEGL